MNKDGKREENLALPVIWHVAMWPEKYKVLPKTAEDELLERMEHIKASIRAKVSDRVNYLALP